MPRRVDETPIRQRTATLDPEPSPGAPAGKQTGDARISTAVPVWLARALGLGAGVPSVLRVKQVAAVLDIYQDGYGVAAAFWVRVVQAAGSAAAVTRVINTANGTLTDQGQARAALPGSAPFIARVLGASLASSIVAAGSLVDLTVRPAGVPTGAAATGWLLRRLTLLASPDVRDTIGVFGQVLERGVPILPGHALDVAMPATAGGEVVTLDLGVLVTPAGFSL